MKKTIFAVMISIILGNFLFAHEGTVTDNRVRIRNSPSTKYSEVVCVVNKGDKLKVVGYTTELDEIDGKKEPWYKVEIENSGYEYCYIYGGYFRPDVNKSELYENKKEYCASYALWELINGGSFSAISINDSDKLKSYYENGKIIKKEDKSYYQRDEIFNKDFFVKKELCVFEYGGFRFTVRYDGDYFYTESVEMISDVKNPLNLKLGIPEDELKKAFGNNVKLNDWIGVVAAVVMKLNCSDGVLKSISFGFEED